MSSHSIRQRAGRSVFVHLPHGYDASRAEPYPLLLLHDGQNLAHSREDAQGGSWHADETIDRLVADGRIPPLVMVGIDHAGEERISEFTPAVSDDSGGPPSVYGRWIVDHLIPELADDLNVRTDVRGVTLGGSSLGGLVTLWIASMSPGQFGRLMVMSPSVWWDNHLILRHLRDQPIATATRIWLDVGKDEGKAVVRDARALRDLLREQHHDQLCYFEDPDGDHTEASWGRRFTDALAWLYRDQYS